MNREDIIRMAREAGLMGNPLAYADWYPEALERFAALVAAAEREAIMAMCDDNRYSHQYVHSFKQAIRARGNT